MACYFADTSFWIAVTSKRDLYHSSALAWTQVVLRSRSNILTTEAVLWEWLNALSDVSTRGVAAEGYRRCHSDPSIEVVPFELQLVSSAVRLYGKRLDKSWSLTDCLSFVVMERRGLKEALTTDRHFEQVNFKRLLLEEPGIES